MYPFDTKWRWLVKNRFRHYTRATRDHLGQFPEPYRTVLRARAAAMERWATIRAVFFTLMNLGIVSTAATLLLDLLPTTAGVETVLQGLLGWLGSLTALFALLFFVSMRVLGQLEADLVSALAVGGLQVARTHHPDNTE